VTVLVLVTVAGTVPVAVAVEVMVWVPVTVSTMVAVDGTPESPASMPPPPSNDTCAFILAVGDSRGLPAGAFGGALVSQPTARYKSETTTTERGIFMSSALTKAGTSSQ
jgi:hypothetical protein